MSRLSETRSLEDNEQNRELDRRVDGQRLPLRHRLANLGIGEARPVFWTLARAA